MSKLETIDLTRCSLSEPQLFKIFETISSSEKVRSLSLWGIGVSKIPPEYFLQLGFRLEQINFSHASLTKDQLTNLLKGISRARKLKSLKIADMRINFHQLESGLLAGCISDKTELLDLFNTSIFGVEVISSPAVDLLITRLQNPHNMSTLCLNNINLNILKTSPGILASSLAGIPRIGLSGCFPSDQGIINTILKEIILQKRVKSLDLSLNNLSSVEPSILGQLVIAIKHVDLSQTCLTIQQITDILASLSHSPKLETLNLSSNNLSQVEPYLLNNLLTLSCAYLNSTRLKPDHVVQLITKGL